MHHGTCTYKDGGGKLERILRPPGPGTTVGFFMTVARAKPVTASAVASRDGLVGSFPRAQARQPSCPGREDRSAHHSQNHDCPGGCPRFLLPRSLPQRWAADRRLTA